MLHNAGCVRNSGTDRSGGELKQTFVATPDGRKHKLTPSEELYLERQKPKARAAYMPGP